MKLDQHRPFGCTGISVPPIAFCSAALGDSRRVIPDQTKLAICGEWLRHVVPPVFIDANADDRSGNELAALGRMFSRLDAAPEELIIHVRLAVNRSTPAKGDLDADAMRQRWQRACASLGDRYAPSLVSLECPGEHLTDKRLHTLLTALNSLGELKAAGNVVGIGIVAHDWHAAKAVSDATELDFVTLSGGITIVRHPPELLGFLASLADRQIAVISAGVFHCGFLVGGSRFDSRVGHADDPVDRPMFAWRKAFAALCHGHGIAPAHACIQFALSAPGVVAVLVNTTFPDRVATNVESVVTKGPDGFWASMKEEGLLAEDYPYLG
jgi:D-threo-aldose 1-dehydrogenase